MHNTGTPTTILTVESAATTSLPNRIPAARIVALLLMMLIEVPGCGILEPELPYQLPDEDTSTDPSALRAGETLYACGRWLGGPRPAADHLLVDVFFNLFGPGGPLEVPGPTVQQRRFVEKYGGVILRSYYVSGLRVWLPTDAVPVMEDSGAVVRSVPEPRRYDTTVKIDFIGTEFQADSLRIVELGGRVVWQPVPYPGGLLKDASVILPNRAIP